MRMHNTQHVRHHRDTLKFIQPRLNWPSAVDFYKKLYTAVHRYGLEKITVDFSEIKNAYPNGIVPIISEIDRYKKQKKLELKVIQPLKEDVKSLFLKNGWLHFLEPEVYEYPNYYGDRSFSLQKFSSDEELNDIVNRAIEICLKQLVFAQGVPLAFEWALNEIAGNVLVHSEAESGWIQVITYPEKQKLTLIVCDSGVGIPSTMKRAFSHIHDDQEALEMALRKGVTSNPRYGQGNGLAGSLAIAQGSNGSFAITSGKGRITLVNLKG